jgi:hypothetical protein
MRMLELFWVDYISARPVFFVSGLEHFVDCNTLCTVFVRVVIDTVPISDPHG